MKNIEHLVYARLSGQEDRLNELNRIDQLIEEWPTWDPERRVRWARKVALRTIQEIFPPIFRSVGLAESADAMASAGDLRSAREAAEEAATCADACADAADTTYAREVYVELSDATRAASKAADVCASHADVEASNVYAVAHATDVASTIGDFAAGDALLVQALDIWVESAQDEKGTSNERQA